MITRHTRTLQRKITRCANRGITGVPAQPRTVMPQTNGPDQLPNENTNGLLREYFPKGTEITGDIHYLNAVADEINGRPRAMLGFGTPAEVFAELLLAHNTEGNLSSIASTG
jgi:hypothetical protein